MQWTFPEVALLFHCFQAESEPRMLVFAEEENWRNWRKTLEARTRRNNKNSTHMWHQVRELNLGHSGERLTLSPPCHPCSPESSKVLAICFSYVGTTMVLFSKYGYQWAKLVAVPKDVWVLQSWDNLRRWHLWLKMNKKQISFRISHTVPW